MKKVYCIVLLLFIITSVKSQFFEKLSNPTINLTLNNPPLLGIKIDKVAFNPINNDCANQVMDVIISDFIENGVEVIDRANLDKILAEHDLNYSGYIDKTTAVNIGEILGPSALVTLKILRCETIVKDDLYKNVKLKDSETGKYYYRKQFVSRTEFILKASIQVTDLTSGRIFATQSFDYNPSRENYSFEGRIEAPSPYEVQELAFKDLVVDIHKLFFYWSQPISLIYFNDKKCGLKEAFEFIKIGDFEKAYTQSLENIEYCSNSNEKDKLKANAFYNMGMSYFINNEFDKAIEMLEKAKSIKDKDIINDALVMCNKARKLSLMSTQFEDKVEMEAQKNTDTKTEKEELVLTNDDIIGLIKAGLPESLIITKIKTSDSRFDTSTNGLLFLVEAGVSEKVIAVMMEK